MDDNIARFARGIVDAALVVTDDRWKPRHGWHDDHRDKDGTPGYLPAVQQVRAEFVEFADHLRRAGVLGGRALQLGVGPCAASHALWQTLFNRVASVDQVLPMTTAGSDLFSAPMFGLQGDTHDPKIIEILGQMRYDFLFIDAGHLYDDVAQDHAHYAPMVRPGGVVAFHDSLRRESLPGLEVWRYLQDFDLPLTQIGDEVGVAYYVREA